MRNLERIIGGGCAIVLVCLLLAGCGDDDGGTKPTGTPGNPATMPRETGNKWTYALTVETQEGDPDNYTVYDEIVGIEEFEGEDYSQVHSIEIDDVQGNTVRVADGYFRQEGQQIWIYEDYDTSGAGLDEYSQFIYGNIIESQPWKVAEFTSLSGESWENLNTEETWELEGDGILNVKVKVTVTNEGRVQLTVPAGTYDDVYKGRHELTVTFTQIVPPLPPVEVIAVETQTVYRKDGVGIVKQESESWWSQAGVEQERVTSVAELKTYELQP